ncbi:hypothetical protein Tco_1285475 [Tanacetum coccineum]
MDISIQKSTKEKYTTSITKHYTARYYKQGIEDTILDRWSKETHRYIFEALNDMHYGEDSKIDFFKVEMRTRIEGSVYSDLRIKLVVRVEVKKKWGYGFLSSIVVRRSDDKEYQFRYANLPRLSLNDVEDMYLLQVQDKLLHILLEFVKDFNNALLLFIKRVMIQNKEQAGTGNKRLNGRDWTDMDVEKLNKMVDKIDKTLKRREQLRRLEEYVGGRPKTINPRTFVRRCKGKLLKHRDYEVDLHSRQASEYSVIMVAIGLSGGCDMEDKAAQSYDLAALKYCSVPDRWEFHGIKAMLEYGVLPSFGYGVLDLVSMVFGEYRHKYAVSSLMDTAYWLSEQIGDVKKNSDAPMPYVVLLTRIYKYILQTNPQSIVPFASFMYHQRVMNPLIIPRKTIKRKGKRVDPPSSSSSSSSNEDEEPSFFQFYEELSNDEDLTDAQREKRGMFKGLNHYLVKITKYLKKQK